LIFKVRRFYCPPQENSLADPIHQINPILKNSVNSENLVIPSKIPTVLRRI